ncbi:Hint domain-containing protein [Rhodobacter maris]|uniref:Hint domain-containing protein n=1 Tax=Rhodobacter maris TaxID=446682 RepID=A0A285SJQ3_9RHOB|nr:Hint domain-containing protein [Rhodobacter maris]SOC07590.1 Hint domain-containing protein [Rhodobacter maris]
MDDIPTGHASGAPGPVAAALSYVFTLPVAPGGTSRAGRSGLTAGAEVATLDGLLPVEYLGPGDRIVTRAGARVLRAVTTLPLITDLVRVAPGTLGQGRPGAALILGAGTEVLLRGWRAEALFGKAQECVAVARLVDGQFITRLTGARMRLYGLHFDAPEIIYAEGVELGCQPLQIRRGAA